LFAVNNGVRQFLDLGAGIPTVGSVHEVAQALDREARVV
jgi:S-adenosyl methyltransferase